MARVRGPGDRLRAGLGRVRGRVRRGAPGPSAGLPMASDLAIVAGQLDPGAETVIINSGDGLKTLDAITAAVDVPTSIRPTLEAFQEAIQ